MTGSKPPSSPPSEPRVREPAVAGTFYPDDPAELRRMIESFLREAKPSHRHARMLVSPHAGYVFSGPVAAYGYACVPAAIDRAIVLGPSHHAWFTGLALPDAGVYRTPLGDVPLDQAAVAELLGSSLVHALPQADEQEHSVEVQVPFLQVRLDEFTIVPIVVGKIAASQAAEVLLPLVTPTTVVVASSDFSHYQPHEQARAIDARSVQTILSGNADGFLDACGELPVRIVMLMAKKLGLCAVLLDQRTSFDTAPTLGRKSRVVGYASIAFVAAGGGDS